jgi:poly(hydroxyalkanoate) depolymerase family esterase
MVKASTQWLRGLVRVGKAQQRSATKLAKSLFGTPAPKARAKPKPKPAPTLAPKPKAAPKPRAAPAAKAAAKPKAAASRAKPAAAPRAQAAQAALPGKWLAGYFSPAPEAGHMPGKRMMYYLYLPDKAPSATMLLKGMPLVVMLHGCDQTAPQFAQGTRMNRLAEKKGYAVLYPQQSLSSHAHRCWKWYDKATQEGGGDVRMIVGIIEQVAQRYAIDRSRIYIGGMSAGAGMADIIALTHPELIAAVGLHSAPVYGAGHGVIGALKVMQHGASQRMDDAIGDVLSRRPAFPPLPAILIQGEADKVVRPVNQTQLTRQSMLLNRMPAQTEVSVDMKPAGRPGSRNPANAHQIRDFQVGRKLLLRVAKIERLEHAWSGGDPSLTYNDKAGPDASKMMLDFFAKHRRV